MPDFDCMIVAFVQTTTKMCIAPDSASKKHYSTILFFLENFAILKNSGKQAIIAVSYPEISERIVLE